MQDDPDLLFVARVAHTFHLDPVRVMNEYSPVQLAALMAAHNVIAEDARVDSEAKRLALDKARAERFGGVVGDKP